MVQGPLETTRGGTIVGETMFVCPSSLPRHKNYGTLQLQNNPDHRAILLDSVPPCDSTSAFRSLRSPGQGVILWTGLSLLPSYDYCFRIWMSWRCLPPPQVDECCQYGSSVVDRLRRSSLSIAGFWFGHKAKNSLATWHAVAATVAVVQRSRCTRSSPTWSAAAVSRVSSNITCAAATTSS